MPRFQVSPPYPEFSTSTGKPLEGGYVYVGMAGLDPELSPLPVFWDDAGSIPAVQPLRTTGGYIIRDGSPSKFYVGFDYSITVRDKNGALVYTELYNRDLAAGSPISYQVSLGDNGARSISLGGTIGSGIAIVSVGADQYGFVIFSNTGAPSAAIITGSANFEVDTGELTGETGADGKFTFSAAAGGLYLENRLGSTKAVQVTIFYGGMPLSLPPIQFGV